MTTGQSLSLADITVDRRVQVRVAGLDADTVAAYATVFGEGGEFPPVVVFRDEEDGTLYLADGFHRVAAARLAGLTEIAAEVRPGGLAGAVEYAEEANLEHGKPLSIRDKRAIFERRVGRGHEWAQMSDREIARRLGVDPKTIGNWRRSLSVEISTVSERVGADGRVYNVRKIQAAAKQRPVSKPSPRYVDDPDVDQRVAEEEREAQLLAWQRPPSPPVEHVEEAVVSVLAKSTGPLSLAQLHNRVEKHLFSRVPLPMLSSIATRLVAYGQVARDQVSGGYYLPDTGREDDEQVVRRLAAQLERAICDLLRSGPLTMSELLAGLRQRGLDAESLLGVAALRVALNRLLESGQVKRDGSWYVLYVPDEAETDGPEVTAVLGQAAGAMETLAAALDNMLGLSVSDQAVLRDHAVRQALGRLWDMFPPLREKLTQAEEWVEALLQQSVDGILGGL